MCFTQYNTHLLSIVCIFVMHKNYASMQNIKIVQFQVLEAEKFVHLHLCCYSLKSGGKFKFLIYKYLEDECYKMSSTPKSSSKKR